MPIHCFNKECLFQIVSCLGKPLFVDAATASGVRPSVARVCVEIDLLQEFPGRIWIGHGGFRQQFLPEHLPMYCSHCFKQGHDRDGCHVIHPGLRVEREERKANPT